MSSTAPKHVPSKPERGAILFAQALQQGPLSPEAARASLLGTCTLQAAKDFAAEHGLVFWLFDWSAVRYVWHWSDARSASEQTWRGMRTRMRRFVLRHRSAIEAARARVPSPGLPIKAHGPEMSTMYDVLVGMGVLYWLATTGKRGAVPLAAIHAEASDVLTRAITPA